jgi:hypothetical protein
MKLKNLLVVVVVLAVLSGVVFWFNRPAPPPSADPRVGQPLVAQSVVEQAAKLRLTDQGKTVTLSRSGSAWKDDSYYGMPADFSKLSSFIGDLAGAKLDRLVTENPDRVARLEFTGTKLELLDASDHPLWTLELGKTADQGGRFVKFSGESKAYLTTLNAWLDTDPKSWADSTLVTVKADDIAKVEVPLEDGSTVKLSREKKDSPWTAAPVPAGQKLNADKVPGILSTLTALHFSDSALAKDPGVAAAETHLRKYLITTFDGKILSIAFGRTPEEKKLKPVDKNAKVDLSFKPGDAAKPAADTKPPTPEYDTTPPGPVYVWLDGAGTATLPTERAFQVEEYNYTGLPQKTDDLFGK